MNNSEIAALHLMGNLHACAAKRGLLEDASTLRQHCMALVLASGLTAVGDYFYQFDPQGGITGGVTGAVILAESHLAVHTWPESDYVTLDVFVCNMQCDNRAKAQQLFNALVASFQSGDPRIYSIDRT